MQAFIARQPIFDAHQEVVGYELLFRGGLENACVFPDLSQASAKVISNSSMLFGMPSLTNGKLAFVNATRDSLLNEHVNILPPTNTVVEILETVVQDQAVIEACQNLKRAGFKLALDDSVDPENPGPLVDLVDIIKVDFLKCPPALQYQFVRRYKPRGVQLLAEKVEDQQTFERAAKSGYQLFQGYFFARPEIMVQRDIPGHKVFYLQMLREVNRPDMNINRLEETLKRDVSLSYKLLRYINSAYFGFQVEVRSFRHALVLLGGKEFKKWATVLLLAGLGDDKPQALLSTAIFRARFLESLAVMLKMEKQSQDLFMMGMFSLIGAITNLPAKEILSDMPIAEEVKVALSGGDNTFRRALDICLAYESGQWQKFSHLGQILRLSEDQVPKLYVEAIDWVQQGFGEKKEP